MEQRCCWLKLNDAATQNGPLVNVAVWAEGQAGELVDLQVQAPSGSCHVEAPVRTEGSLQTSWVLGSCDCCPEGVVENPTWGQRFDGSSLVAWRATASAQAQPGWHLEGPSLKGAQPGLDVTMCISPRSFADSTAAVDWLKGATGVEWSTGAKAMWLITQQG